MYVHSYCVSCVVRVSYSSVHYTVGSAIEKCDVGEFG